MAGVSFTGRAQLGNATGNRRLHAMIDHAAGTGQTECGRRGLASKTPARINHATVGWDKQAANPVAFGRRVHKNGPAGCDVTVDWLA